MIPGFNTDVVHDGITYHVQTEDKGMDAPMILSLVYRGGAILASKRTPYEDLLATDFDESALSERLQRQHKLICAAIRNGRLEDLKRLNERAPQIPSAAADLIHADQDAKPAPVVPLPSMTHVVRNGVADFARREVVSDAPVLTLLDEEPLFAGRTYTLRVRLTRGADAPGGVLVTVKILGTAFEQSVTHSTTNTDGIASAQIAIPTFKSGRAVLMISSIYESHEVVLRRLVQAVLDG